MVISPEISIGQLVKEKPHSVALLDSLKWDYCCGGDSILSEKLKEASLGLDEFVEQLNEVAFDGSKWECPEDSLTAICDHIEEVHHRHLEVWLPEIVNLSQKVSEVYGDRFPKLVQLNLLLEEFQIEMSLHMAKEEKILFPCLRIMEQKGRTDFHCGSLNNPIRNMLEEHDNAGAFLMSFKTLTNNYTVPDDTCTVFFALMENLKNLELDMKQHIHKENNILFPLSVKLEEQLTNAQGGQ